MPKTVSVSVNKSMPVGHKLFCLIINTCYTPRVFLHPISRSKIVWPAGRELSFMFICIKYNESEMVSFKCGMASLPRKTVDNFSQFVGTIEYISKNATGLSVSNNLIKFVFKGR